MSPVLDKIRAIRSKRGYSQDYIAQKLDVDVSTYGKVERGIIELTVDRLEKIASEFGMSVSDVYAFDVNPKNEALNEIAEPYYANGRGYEVSVTIRVNNPGKEKEILKMLGLKN